MSDPLDFLDDHFDAELTGERARELSDYIKMSPENADRVVRAASVHRRLRESLTASRDFPAAYLESRGLDDAQILPALREAAGPVESCESDPFISMPAPACRNVRRRSVFALLSLLATAAVIVIAAMIVRQQGGLSLTRSRPTFTAFVDAQWKSAFSFTAGGAVPDERLALLTGFAQITTERGASVVLEGPANFRFDSDGKLLLQDGILTAHVPAAAKGFTVKTPHATLMDLGTEFGVDVRRNEETHAEVFVGKVQAWVGDGKPSDENRILASGKAVQIDAGAKTIQDAAAQPLLFLRPAQFAEMIRTRGETAYDRWFVFNRQLQTDPHLLAHYLFNQSGLSPDVVLYKTLPDAGRFSETSALRWNGKESRAQINIPGSFPQLTFAAWINIHSLPHDYNSLLCADGKGQFSPHWCCVGLSGAQPAIQFGVRYSSENHWKNYDFPALRLGTGFNFWHFVAISYDVESRSVRASMDGESLGAQTLENANPLTIGPAQIGNWNAGEGSSTRGFDGSFDEFAIWDRTLSQDELHAMYRAGSPQ